MLGDKVTTMPLGICPFLGKKCLGAKCALWERYDREDGTRVEACTFVLQSKLMAQQVVEQMRNQASTDKVANVIHRGVERFVSLVNQPRLVTAELVEEVKALGQ